MYLTILFSPKENVPPVLLSYHAESGWQRLVLPDRAVLRNNGVCTSRPRLFVRTRTLRTMKPIGAGYSYHTVGLDESTSYQKKLIPGKHETAEC